ncbi:TPA: hypothetical protein PRX66_004068 [Escherichia coli]|nr:hypothetical protein [Escherichia coli]HDK2152093.1 hypothetical protein [Escherichia coli]
MQWKIINGWYCVTACGFMSWKFRTLQEGIKWAFVSKEARDVANDNEISSCEQRCMSALLRHWSKWSGWYLFLASVSAWLYLLALIFREGWIK